MVMHIFYAFPSAPVCCNDTKSDTVSNESTPDHNLMIAVTFIVVKEAVLVLEIPDPILLQQARCG